ncbi:hypothetical protein BKA70DRAFT_325924 [Coprinopsis sp. MPI-PUGE-AT-0042]|nr:hypothetical protein BKA70DRAFT_325924 [Coprinopsis sp. MPI-PUGE-AT-0042]
MSTEEAPMLLTRVCRRWREAALTMPVLWSTLHIPVPAPPVKPSRAVVPRWDLAGGFAVGGALAGLNPPPGFNAPTAQPAQPPSLRPEEERIAAHCQRSYEVTHAAWKTKMATRVAAVDAWFARSGGLKISFNIVEWAPPPDRGMITHGWKAKLVPLKQQLVEVLRKYRAKWQRVELSLTWRLLAEILGTEAPNLAFFKITHAPMSPPNFLESNHRLSLPFDSDDESDIAEEPTAQHEAMKAIAKEMWVASPLLSASRRTLSTLYLKALTGDIFTLPVKWNTVTELFFEGYSSRFSSWSPIPTFNGNPKFTKNEAIQLLKQLPNIRKCHLLIGKGRFPTADLPTAPVFTAVEPQAPIPLEYLEHLSIHETKTDPRDENLVPLFNAFEFPALSSLVYTTTVVPRPNQQTSLLTLLSSCGSHIRKLAIDYRSFTPADLARIMELVSDHIEELWLTVDYWETRESRYPDSDDWLQQTAGALGNQLPLTRPMPAFLMNEFLEKLTPKVTGLFGDEQFGPTLCPNLSSFTCRLKTAEFDEEALLDFIRARRHRGVVEAGIVKRMIENVKVHFAVQRPRDFQDDDERPKVRPSDPWVPVNKPKVHAYVAKRLRDDPMVSLQEELSYPVGSIKGKERATSITATPPLVVDVTWPAESRINFFGRGFPDLPLFASRSASSTRIWSPASGALGATSILGTMGGEYGGVTDSGVRIF